MAMEGKNSTAGSEYYKLLQKYAPSDPDPNVGYAVMPADMPLEEWVAEQERKNKLRTKPTTPGLTDSFEDKDQ